MAGVAERSPPRCGDKRSEILIEERAKVAQRLIKRAAKSAATGVSKQQDRDGGVTVPTQEEQLVIGQCSNKRQHDMGGSRQQAVHGFRLGWQ
ncbi:hypothetical protein NL676_034909 [Syzygium grande]|nr:hypothetical protein NL676_034909 [Syzygium grande]